MRRMRSIAVAVVTALVAVVAYAQAATLTADLAINARVASKFTLTLSTYSIDWTNGGIGYQPSDPTLFQTIVVTIDSNRAGDLTAAWIDPPAADFDIFSTLEQDNNGVPFASGAGQTFNDEVSFNPDNQTPPGVTDTSVLRYSAVQDP